jgi:hypothetical protein
MRIQVDAPVGDLDVTTPVIAGRIEVQEGPTFPTVGKNLTLTRLALRFADLNVRHDIFGGEPVPLRHIGLQVLDGVVTWALEEQPNVFTADIPPVLPRRAPTPIAASPRTRLVPLRHRASADRCGSAARDVRGCGRYPACAIPHRFVA